MTFTQKRKKKDGKDHISLASKFDKMTLFDLLHHVLLLGCAPSGGVAAAGGGGWRHASGVGASGGGLTE